MGFQRVFVAIWLLGSFIETFGAPPSKVPQVYEVSTYPGGSGDGDGDGLHMRNIVAEDVAGVAPVYGNDAGAVMPVEGMTESVDKKYEQSQGGVGKPWSQNSQDWQQQKQEEHQHQQQEHQQQKHQQQEQQQQKHQQQEQQQKHQQQEHQQQEQQQNQQPQQNQQQQLQQRQPQNEYQSDDFFEGGDEEMDVYMLQKVEQEQAMQKMPNPSNDKVSHEYDVAHSHEYDVAHSHEYNVAESHEYDDVPPQEYGEGQSQNYDVGPSQEYGGGSQSQNYGAQPQGYDAQSFIVQSQAEAESHVVAQSQDGDAQSQEQSQQHVVQPQSQLKDSVVVDGYDDDMEWGTDGLKSRPNFQTARKVKADQKKMAYNRGKPAVKDGVRVKEIQQQQDKRMNDIKAHAVSVEQTDQMQSMEVDGHEPQKVDSMEEGQVYEENQQQEEAKYVDGGMPTASVGREGFCLKGMWMNGILLPEADRFTVKPFHPVNIKMRIFDGSGMNAKELFRYEKIENAYSTASIPFSFCIPNAEAKKVSKMIVRAVMQKEKSNDVAIQSADEILNQQEPHFVGETMINSVKDMQKVAIYMMQNQPEVEPGRPNLSDCNFENMENDMRGVAIVVDIMLPKDIAKLPTPTFVSITLSNPDNSANSYAAMYTAEVSGEYKQDLPLRGLVCTKVPAQVQGNVMKQSVSSAMYVGWNGIDHERENGTPKFNRGDFLAHPVQLNILDGLANYDIELKMEPYNA